MEDIYRKYFQKSRSFLYPILQLDKKKSPRPLQTYISWNGLISAADKKLICLYQIEDTSVWKTFESEVLMTHPMLETSILLTEDKIVYVFDMSGLEFVEDYNIFLEGKYSKLSSETKKRISDYYGIHTPEWIYMESYLFPKRYYKEYAKILKEPLANLKGGELTDKYDSEQECCTIPIENIINY